MYISLIVISLLTNNNILYKQMIKQLWKVYKYQLHLYYKYKWKTLNLLIIYKELPISEPLIKSIYILLSVWWLLCIVSNPDNVFII